MPHMAYDDEYEMHEDMRAMDRVEKMKSDPGRMKKMEEYMEMMKSSMGKSSVEDAVKRGYRKL